ncbi:MAG: hypothetical protein ACT4PT_12490 [Methanobacteriota archaeon]
MEADWVTLANDGLTDLSQRSGIRDKACLRSLLVERLRQEVAFPLHAAFRGYATGRVLKAPLSVEDGRLRGDRGNFHRFVELVPPGYEQATYEVLGGVLVEADADFGAGSVLRVSVRLLDPALYGFKPPAMLSDLEAMKVEVGVTR